MTRTIWFIMVGIALLMGCGATPSLVDSSPPKAYDLEAARTLADDFYEADSFQAMRAASDALNEQAPDSALRHEVSAELAVLRGRHEVAVTHLLKALDDHSGDAPLYLLHRLTSLSWNKPARTQVELALDRLSRTHPDSEVRALCSWMLGHAAHLRGDTYGLNDALNAVTGQMRPWIVGPFDNDQGKGFDAAYGPELGLDVTATYAGKLAELKWRHDYQIDPRGKIDLQSMLYPTQWQSAYGASFFSVTSAGPYELRLSSSVPSKVWVDGRLVFSGRRLDGWSFDAIVIPLDLDAGSHSVLVKSAQNKGSWLMHLRLTGTDGRPLGTQDWEAIAPFVTGPVDNSTKAPSGVDVVRARVKHLGLGGRAQAHTVRQLRMLGIASESVAQGESFIESHPSAFFSRYLLALAAWDHEERGQAADLLNMLVQDFGAEFPEVLLKQARFWRQQKMVVKARTMLLEGVERFPNAPALALMLADTYDAAGWTEERCKLLKELDEREAPQTTIQLKLAHCLEQLQLFGEAEALYEVVLVDQAQNLGAMRNAVWHARRRNDFRAAAKHAKALVAAWPHRQDAWEALGEVYRRDGQNEKARGAWERMRFLAPHSPKVYDRLARLALQEGRKKDAVAAWRKHLVFDPDNEKVSKRIAWLQPEDEAEWLADVPDAEAIKKAVAARESVELSPGANIAYLLDDEVTFIGTDGGASGVVTLVAHAANQVGRDQLTRMNVRGGGTSQILRAYAVLPDGKRIEASSIRRRTLRFRQLTVGSTVVLQYRIDERPDGYLAGHLARRWWFQGAGVQTHLSRWVLWRRQGVELQTAVLGKVDENTLTKNGLIRTEWAGRDLPPVSQEPYMPGLGQVASNVLVSTVPDWDQFWKWEQALLLDAFRDTPELVDLAKEITAGTETVHEKLEAIQAYLMTEIRYQQDYERNISGVKPHAAPVVVARQYGDCKDKAVLFITLARLVGVDVHFALVRTRDMGPVEQTVPMQQFNHAIVYVPKQDGFDEDRFYDPTVDALDVPVLRHDDQGTLALVYNPQTQEHRWRPIPFQKPDMDTTSNEMIASLDSQGRLEAEVEVKSQGRFGSLLRRGARNAERFEQMLEKALVSGWVEGATMTDHAALQVASVMEPARIRLKLVADAAGRLNQGQMRVKVPINWRPSRWFSLGKRQHDLLLGTPRTMRWSVELLAPRDAKIKSTPNSVSLKAPCLSLKRKVKDNGRTMILEQEVQILCERISSHEYETHRKASVRMLSALNEEVVLDLN